MKKENDIAENPVTSTEVVLTPATVSADESPSSFLDKGFPYCSIFGETNHECYAVTLLSAMADAGDVWQQLTPQQVYDYSRKNGPYVTSNYERMKRVIARLRSSEDARAFSFVWRVKPNPKLRDADQKL